MKAVEANFDGLVGPTHNYAGLSYGNVASSENLGTVSRPREAALQGLQKMKALRDMGLVQGVLPPQERPDVMTLRGLGFSGDDGQIVQQVGREDPVLLAAVCSASSMWTANAATVAPSADTRDGKVHFTAANLAAKFHRGLESKTTSLALQRVFSSGRHFQHHAPLPISESFGDEGAANHTRLCGDHGEPGLQIFVYGRHGFRRSPWMPSRFPARQTMEASRAIARLHQLDGHHVLLVQQNPEAIDAGVFHNDVISVGNQQVLLYHERAFTDTPVVIEAISSKLELLGGSLVPVMIQTEQIPLQRAVSSYLFNSQLVTTAPGQMALLAPGECREDTTVRRTIDAIVAEPSNPIASVHYFDLRQSMRNGGGPACLRLRVTLTDDERSAVNQACLLTDRLHDRLSEWIRRNYREELSPTDLADPNLLTESRTALDELTQILELGSIYPFQGA